MLMLILYSLLGSLFHLNSVTAQQRGPAEIEELYIEGLYQTDLYLSTNELCNASDALKLDLCKRVIWELVNKTCYYNLYLNLNAYANGAPDCEPHTLTFITRPEDTKRKIRQMMLPCRGQHNPLRTSMTVDDYYDAFFISRGTVPNTSLMVYKREMETEWDSFRPLEQFDTSKINPEGLSAVTLETESSSTLEVSYNDNEKEVEIIYIREMINNKQQRIPDPLANYEKGKLINLCAGLFGVEKYQNLDFQLNETAFLQLDVRNPERDEQVLVFIHEDYCNFLQFTQQMFPCFGKSPGTQVPWNEDKKLMQYQISHGPRPSSIVIYKFEKLQYYSGYRPVELVENLDLDSLSSLTKDEVTDLFHKLSPFSISSSLSPADIWDEAIATTSKKNDCIIL